MDLLEFIKGPVVCGAVLEVLNLDSDNGSGERSGVTVFLGFRRQQLRGKWGVQCVCQQHKLELDLKRR